MIKPFNDSDFCVTWQGECPESYLIHGWEAVKKHLLEQTGEDDLSCEWLKQFEDVDSWETLDNSYAHDDERHVFSEEIDESIYLTITRITEYAIEV